MRDYHTQDRAKHRIVGLSLFVLSVCLLSAYLLVVYRWARLWGVGGILFFVWLQIVPRIYNEAATRFEIYAEAQEQFARDYPILNALGMGYEKPANPTATVLLFTVILTTLGFLAFVYMP